MSGSASVGTSSTASASPPSARTSCRIGHHGGAPCSSGQLTQITRPPAPVARRAASSASRVLPMPAGPVSTSHRVAPAAESARVLEMSADSRSRPISTPAAGRSAGALCSGTAAAGEATSVAPVHAGGRGHVANSGDCRRIRVCNSRSSASGIQTQFGVEMCRVTGIRLERLGSPSGPVQRQHVQPARPVPQRFTGPQCGGIGQRTLDPALRQQRRHPVLQAFGVQLVDTYRLGRHPVVVGEVLEQPATRQCQGGVGGGQRAGPVAGSHASRASAQCAVKSARSTEPSSGTRGSNREPAGRSARPLPPGHAMPCAGWRYRPAGWRWRCRGRRRPTPRRSAGPPTPRAPPASSSTASTARCLGGPRSTRRPSCATCRGPSNR